jgi:hypothetical protein
MTQRLATLAAMSAFSAVVLLTVGCSPDAGAPRSASEASTPAASATDSFDAMANRERQLTPLFVQCLARHSIAVWDRADGRMNLAVVGAKWGWYRNGRVTADSAFYVFYQDIGGAYPLGPGFKPVQMVDQWVDDAAAAGTGPRVCGPVPSAG